VPDSPSASRGFARRILLVGAVALVVRVGYLLALGRDTEGVGDFFFYHLTANGLADGRGYRDLLTELAGVPYPTALHPPLWSGLLAVVSWFGGDTVLAHRLVGCVVGAAVVVALGYLGRAVGGDRLGLIAGGLAAVTPNLVAADGSLLAESLYGLFVVPALVLAVRAGRELTPRIGFAIGLLLGLAALTRGEGLLFLPLLAVPLALLSRTGRRGLTAVAVLAGAAVLIAPWTVRNQLTFGQFVPISTNDSTVLAGANCPQTYSGPEMGSWSLDCIVGGDLRLNEAEQADVWRERGQTYVREHKGRLPAVAAVRVLRTWDFWQPHRQVRLAEGRDRGVTELGLYVYYGELALGLAGLVLLRRRRMLAAVLASPLVVVSVTSVLGFGLPRFRHAAELVLVVLAAVTLERVTRRLTRRRTRRREPAPLDLGESSESSPASVG
jgi:hypothetical protein